MPDPAQTIIVKKVKKGGHGHHGGAWKVAFADFVTAMMAFFLLLWLLGNTTEEQRAGISDYFNEPNVVSTRTGASNAVIDMGGGMNIPSGAGDNPDELYPDQGQPREHDDTAKQTLDDLLIDEQSLAEQAEAAERERLGQLLEELREAIDSAPELDAVRDQIMLDLTSEGLRIQIADRENRPMFDRGSAVLQSYARDILGRVVEVIDAVPNRISISGHTDRTPYVSRDGYSNWELSADRANAARRELLAAGLVEEKIGRVVGLASSVLYDRSDPFNPINRRISIIVMTKEAEEQLSVDGAPIANQVGDPGAVDGAAQPAAARQPPSDEQPLAAARP